MKQQLAAKDQELRGKEREIDLLYGSSPLTDADLGRSLAEVLLQKSGAMVSSASIQEAAEEFPL